MDIDLDFPTFFNPLQILKQAIPASMVKDGVLVKHPCGIYLQNIPVDSHTGLAAIPYKDADQEHYFKIDFLHLSLLDSFSSKQEIRELIHKEPDWSLLLNKDVVPKLFQLSKHRDILQQIKPTDIQTLADTMALIRPQKRQLLSAYLRDKEKTRPHLYRQGEDDKSSFKKSHSLVYSLCVVLQLHLIQQGRL